MRNNTIEQNTPSKLRSADGFTLIEVMLALAILVIGIVGVFSLQLVTVKGNASAISLSRAVLESAAVVDRIESLDYDDNELDTDTGLDMATLFGSSDAPSFATIITYDVTEQSNLKNYFSLQNDSFSGSSCKVVDITSTHRANGQEKTLTNQYFKFDAVKTGN